MLSNPLLEKDRRTGLISKYSKTITQYKFDLMTLNLTTFQNIIYGHQQILIDLQEKLLKSCNESLKQAIENRQEAMKKRHEIYLKHKLVQYVQRLIRQRSDIVIRRTDKRKVFYIGKAVDFERKAEEYMLKTEAYEEIKNGRCPLADNLHAVQTLFDYLV
ncbi:unnamed protein product, partial [Adineta steineri]